MSKPYKETKRPKLTREIYHKNRLKDKRKINKRNFDIDDGRDDGRDEGYFTDLEGLDERNSTR